MWQARCAPWIGVGILLALTSIARSGGEVVAALEQRAPLNTEMAGGAEQVRLSATRAEIPLSGQWRFVPGSAGEAPKAGWGYARVPGSWFVAELIMPGEGAVWNNYDGRKVNSAWYETTITMPKDWEGRRVLLDVRRVSTDATVYVDGLRVGVVNWPEGEVDLTNHLAPGKPATLRMNVVATTDQRQTVILMGAAPGQNEVVDTQLHAAGLVGRIALQTRPMTGRLDGVFIKTSTRNKKLTLDIDLIDIAQPGRAKVEVVVSDLQGNVVKTFDGEIEAVNGTATLDWLWPGAKLWDVHEPNLYTLTLTLKGAGVDDQIVERFGFREFWIEGREFFLNGKRLRLRPDLMGGRYFKVDRDKFLAERSMGFNFGEYWPHDLMERGTPYNGWEGYAVADEIGLPISGLTPHMGWMAMNVDSPAKLAEFQRLSGREMRRHRNHPSILMWGTSGNMFGPIMDPSVIGQREASEPGRLQRSPHMIEPVKLAQQGVDVLKAIDPTRPVFIHHGGATGDVYTMNHYLNMIPLQEREEWLSTYVVKGDMPIMYVEFGTPVYATMMRGRNNYGNAQQTEPFMSEYVAAYLGRESYAFEPADYRAQIVKQFKGGQRYDGWHWDKTMKFAPSWLDLQQLFLTNTWRSWRTAGMTGGMIPWDDAYAELDGKRTIAGEALARNNGPTLAWIAGPEETFTDKSRNFRPGQRVRKSVALVNDERHPTPYKLTARVMLNGQQIAEVQREGVLEVARSTFVPIEFDVPPELSGAKIDGEISLNATIGDHQHADRFPFRAFSNPATQARSLRVYDPAGKSAALLKLLGHDVIEWDGRPAADAVLVVGREALQLDKPLPGDLDAFAQAGGRVLILQQRPEVISEGLGARVCPLQTRRVFRVNENHPAVSGLDDLDLRDWAGTGTLLEPYPDYINDPRFSTMSPANFPLHGWRWGNRHTVTSAAIEKPHRAGWTPILECEFDLAYTPLMELRRGAGKVVWCQLDLEDQAIADPAAEYLARQLVEYVATTPVVAQPKAFYIGNDSGAMRLTEMGAILQRADALPESGTLVVGDASGLLAEMIRTFAGKGNRVVVIGEVEGWATPLREKFAGSLHVPAWPETRGLSPSDLRNRADAPARLIQPATGLDIVGGGLIARELVGTGSIVITTINPELLRADELTYHRLTRWRQTRAMTQLLANAGVAFHADARLLAPARSRPVPPSIPLAGQWQAKLTAKMPAAATPDEKHADPGISDEARDVLTNPNAPFAGALQANMPTEMGLIGDDWKNLDGEAVFRRWFNLTPALEGKDLVVRLAAVDDYDSVSVNGTIIGSTGAEDVMSWQTKRVYRIPASLLKPRDNVLVVRVWDAFGGGGFTTSHPADLRIDLPDQPAAADPIDALYHPDYRNDFDLGDDPYRYYNW
jgi:beta-galactosidase